MINIKDLVERPNWYIKKFSDKNYNLVKEVKEVIGIYLEYQKGLTVEQDLRTKLNKISEKIKSDSSDSLREEATLISKAAKEQTSENENFKNEIEEIASHFPNPTADEINVGVGKTDNIVISTHLDELKEQTNAIPHWDFLEKNNLILSKEAGYISGSRHVIYSGKMVDLVRAVEQFMLDSHKAEGIELIEPPVIVNKKALFNTGQLPKFEEDLYKLDNNQYLIPTAEVPLTNLVTDRILNSEELPIRFAALTNCFRQEAGSAGKDTRGLIRLHQFRKVELVTIGHPFNEEVDFNNMLKQTCSLLESLKLPYRIISLSTGDTSFAAKKTYDVEVWMPGTGNYREVSSVSSAGDFQARRMNTRIKIDDKKQNVYTYNGSALAIERTIAAIIENYIDANGKVIVPTVLKKYISFEEI